MSGHRGGRGRGWYYKQKYGGGRGGGGGRGPGPGGDAKLQRTDSPVTGEASRLYDGFHVTGGRTAADLAQCLRRIHGKGYGAYKDILGRWDFEGFSLHIDHTQADAFAPPSRCRVKLPHSIADFPKPLWSSHTRKTALVDFLTRRLATVVSTAGADIRTEGGGWAGKKGGEITVDMPGQHVVERTSVLIDAEGVEARFTVALPAQGRSILGDWASRILVDNIPKYVAEGLRYDRQDSRALQRHIDTVEDTEALRAALPGLRLVAFVGDGSVLPRQSGASDKPMDSLSNPIPFESPPSMAVEVDLPIRGRVRGMGIPVGVTLFVGGGFHGKSTILKAIEGGVYNKVPGDGRELVATDPSAVKIRAEDGRFVASVDISPFINNLPYGKSTRDFSTPDASGSTSQAANTQEALEMGSSLLLLDEDTCATNFMARDARMQALVAKDKEPITPFLAKIRPLAARGVSCILVIGGSGDYFDVADKVICMEAFQAKEVTEAAHEISRRFAAPESSTTTNVEKLDDAEAYGPVPARRLVHIHSSGGGNARVVARTKEVISYGDEEIDLSAVEQIAEKSQTRAIADSISFLCSLLHQRGGGSSVSLAEAVSTLEAAFDEKGLDVLNPERKYGHYVRPRRFEIAAAVNRLRSLRVAS